MVARRDLRLARTRDEAVSEATTLFQQDYRGFGMREIQKSLIVRRSAERIAALERLERIGVTPIVVRCALGEPKQAMQTIIRILGEKVIPRLRS